MGRKMKNAVIGFPRVGKLRELKFLTEKYFKGSISQEELETNAKALRAEHWQEQKKAGISYISSNDFSYYDGMLDLTVLLGAIPTSYQELGLSKLDTYFAMARGYQGKEGDVKAFAMKKWFNTNYHYMVPELYDDTKITLADDKPFREYEQAKQMGIDTKPVIIGPLTFLKLASYNGTKVAKDYVADLVKAYGAILEKCKELGIAMLQIDEPILVTDLTQEEVSQFVALYEEILAHKGNTKVLLQTYFGDVRDCYQELIALDFDGIGLDFVEGKETKSLLYANGFPANKTLFAGVVNGKNIWKCNYKKTVALLKELCKVTNHIVISTSCSLLHVPYTIENEAKLSTDVVKYFAFAKEKLLELKELSKLLEDKELFNASEYIANQIVFEEDRVQDNLEVQQAVQELSEQAFIRKPERRVRAEIQRKALQLPLFPTTTIGSFPQTREVKQNRTEFRNGEISKETYDNQIRVLIKECIALQEKLDIDVLVHGEYERNDMVEFFGENLEGYIFTEKAWVQSYGTRCVKPPIIFGDIKRSKPITVAYSKYAQSLTKKPVKGMLTGPVTILNWSFPREDVSLAEMAYQIGLAIKEEVMDLEKAGINIIQIDEAALKEKLPIKKADWRTEYLDWAIPAFRLCASEVKAETQIHTHMCYSEFDEIVKDIDDMDADVISFEASRSKLTILNALQENQFETEVGPGVYDIHSPRVPSVEEIEQVLETILKKVFREKLWVNPDCGLKTRGIIETEASLKNLVTAAKIVRKKYLNESKVFWSY